MHNVHISDNTIVNCKTAAIGVQYCKHARVENNSIQNPMAAGLQTAWGKAKNYDNPSAILCNAVADVTIAGNRITLTDPQLVPEVGLSLFLMASGTYPRCDPTGSFRPVLPDMYAYLFLQGLSAVGADLGVLVVVETDALRGSY